MAGFQSYDEVINALSVRLAGQSLQFNKLSSALGAMIPHSFWAMIGNPAAGGYGALGKTNGRVLTRATQGAIPYRLPSGGRTMHLVKGEATLIQGALGTLVLVDRIADVLLSHNEASGSLGGVDATSRLPLGGGAQLWIEVQSALSAASNTLTFGYTNQDGTPGRTTQSIVTTASQAANRSVNSVFFQPLQAGDSGIRTLDAVSLVSGAGTGQIAACLVRPLARFPLPLSASTTSRDFVMELPSLPQIFDESCLALLYVGSSTSAPIVEGELLIADN